LGAIAKRTPEVMVKISGGGKGMKQIKGHLEYISRNGKIELEDQDGNKLNGVEDVRSVREEWQYGGFAISEEGSRREAFNIVLSMPAGTDELGVKRAARDFAEREFDGHQYVMALHTFSTDPDPHPSRNPHVHLAVKATSIDGSRLNPRKADLQRWREDFALALRENGIEAAATNRQQRLNRTRGTKQSVIQKQDRGERLDMIGKVGSSPERIEKAKTTEKRVLQNYRDIAQALAKSDDVDDRSLAVGLVNRLSETRKRTAPEIPSEKGIDR
jgi:hypothetical protein